jgi:hypothetical protein
VHNLAFYFSILQVVSSVWLFALPDWLSVWDIFSVLRLQSTSSMTVHSVRMRRSNPSYWRSAATWTMLRAN